MVQKTIYELSLFLALQRILTTSNELIPLTIWRWLSFSFLFSRHRISRGQVADGLKVPSQTYYIATVGENCISFLWLHQKLPPKFNLKQDTFITSHSFLKVRNLVQLSGVVLARDLSWGYSEVSQGYCHMKGWLSLGHPLSRRLTHMAVVWRPLFLVLWASP